jgi:polysaccharide export outer membrane protein
MHPLRLYIAAALVCVVPALTQSQGTALPSTPTAGQAATDSAEYVFGPEDVLSVTVLKHPEFSDTYLVPASGIVQISAVGDVMVAGMTRSDLRKHIIQKLRDRLRNPEVVVSLKVARMQRIYVLGDVKSPGVFDLKEGWSVAESLSAAGGLANEVQMRDCKVVIERAGGQGRLEVSLESALNGLTPADKEKGIKPEDLRPRPGDVIRIEAVEMLPVFVSGKVRTPGLFRLRRDTAGVLEAIAQAEGVVDGAALGSVRIIRPDGTEETVDLSAILAKDTVREGMQSTNPETAAPTAATHLPRLKGGEIILVPESLDRFAILGYVTKPGYYSLPNGRRYTMAEALAAAEGADKRGRISRIGLVRMENGKETRRVYDLGKYLRGGDTKQNPEILPGDVLFVPETNRVDIATVLSGISSSALFFSAIRR